MIGSELSIQQQLFNKVRLLYPDAIAKKIDKDNFVDIFIASVHEKKGWHLFFNTAKDKIKSGFYCRDTEFVEKVLATDQTFELYSQGIRLVNNPEFTDPDLAVHAAENLLIKIREAYYVVSENKSSDPIFDQKNVPTEDDQQEDDQQEDGQQEDDNKGFPYLTIRMREDEEGNYDEELNAQINRYLVNWQCPTKYYKGREGIYACVPEWIGKIDNDNCCPKFSDREMALINNKILNEKIIPILNYAPEELLDQTKHIWWIVPFSIFSDDNASWLMVDKNGIYGAHPYDDDINSIVRWDDIEDWEYNAVYCWLSDEGEYENEIKSIDIHLEDGILTLVEFVSPGMGSYLSVIDSIYKVRYKTIQASKGAASWYEGVGGEGFKSFEKPRDLLIANKWEEPLRPDPKRFGYDVRTEEEKMADQYLILDQKNMPTVDDSKGFPMLNVRLRKNEEGINDEELNARINNYLVNWLCPTEAYAGRLGIFARVPEWIGKIDNDNCCPKYSVKEIEFINDKIRNEKIYPHLEYAPWEFGDQINDVWWIVPFSIFEENKASWLMVDQNGIYGAHPGDDDIAMIASWRTLEKLVYRSFDNDTEEEEIHSIDLHFDNGMLTLVEFVPPGRGSYLSVIDSIYAVRHDTIQASKGSAYWYDGIGGEGFIIFEKPSDLLEANKWDEPIRYNTEAFEHYHRLDHLEQGKEKLENKDFQGAIQEFTKVIEIDPSEASTYQKRGKCRSELEDFAGAIEDFDKAITLDPNFWGYYYNRGDAKKNSKDLKGAIADYNKVSELNPSEASTYQQRGRCKFILEDFAGAIEDFDKAITLDPNSWVFYYDRGDAKKNSKDLKGAIADYNKVIELNPSDDSIYQQSGRCKSELKDFAGAIEDFDKAIAIKPNRWGYYYDRGNAKKNSKDLKGAIADYNKVSELNPSHEWTINNRGNCKSDLEDFAGAIEDFDNAITLNPNWWGYYFNRGNAKKNSKDLKGAIADYNKVSELNPSYESTYQNRGKCKAELKDHKGAIEDLNRVIAIDPDYRWAYEPLGVAKKALEDLQGAIQAFDIGIEKGAQWPSIRYNRAKTKHLIKDFKGAIEDYEELINSESFDLGVFYNLQLAKREEDCFEGDLKEDVGSLSTEAYKNALVVRANRFSRQGNNKKAIEDINELIGMDPSLGYPYCYLGNFKLKSKDYQGAIEALNTAIEKNEDLFNSYRNRADAKKGLNDYTGALADYTKVIEIDPDDDTAYKGRGLVKMLLKDFKGAIEDFTKFIDIGQRHNYDFVFFERGKAKFQLGEYKGAFEDMNEAIEIDPKYAPYYFERGSLKKELNDQKGALADYNKAVLLDPEKIEFYSSRSELKLMMGDEQGAALDNALSEFYGLPADERPQSDYLKINLLKLIEHTGETDFEQIKNSVIANAILVESEFDRLAKDVNFIVRAATALNPHISENLLSELLRDKEKLVRLTARKNTTLTDYMIENLPKEITKKELVEKLFGEGEVPDSGTPAADIFDYKYELEVTVEDAILISGCQRPNPGDENDPQAKETIIIEAADYIADDFKEYFIESFYFHEVEGGPISKVELEDWINESIQRYFNFTSDWSLTDEYKPIVIYLELKTDKRYCLEDLNPAWTNETYFVIEG